MNASAITEWKTCKRFSIFPSFFALDDALKIYKWDKHILFISLFPHFVYLLYVFKYLHRELESRTCTFFGEKMTSKKEEHTQLIIIIITFILLLPKSESSINKTSVKSSVLVCMAHSLYAHQKH